MKETIASRLAELLRRLNEGERLDPQQLSEEYGVNLRTIQRDLNERLCFLDLQKSGGFYHVSSRRFGLLTPKDVERFASVAGLQGLHPRLSTELLKELLDTKLQSLQIRGHEYEDITGREEAFRQIKHAIEHRHPISFRYSKQDGEKLVDSIEPYKLINQGGIWYMAASDAGALKSYSFTKINALLVDVTEQFSADAEITKTLEREDSIWLNLKKTEVVLKIDSEAADYFRRRKLIDGQKIEKELADGGLLISCLIAHPNQILPTVRYWLPHAHVISPSDLQEELELQLGQYIGVA